MTLRRTIVFMVFICLVDFALADSLSVKVTDASGQAVKDAIVYLQPKNAMKVSETSAIEIEQKNKLFNPFISVIPTGTTATFPNHDGIGHHVYSFSETKTFELPLSEEELSQEILFDKPGVVTIGCNIHDWMVAYIYIVDTPYFAKTNSTGLANLEKVTPGEYELHIWHPGSIINKDSVSSITIAQDQVTQETFTLDIRPDYFWKPAPPPDIEQQEY